jgi:molecular chaperone GrpE
MKSDPTFSTGELSEVDGKTSEVVTSDLRALQADLAAANDRFLRLAADFDNYKKRVQRESRQRAAAEKESFIRDLLPVVDNFERALGSEPPISSQSLHQGVEMTLQQLRRLLREHGIEPTEDVGQLFDPSRHEAVAVEHNPTKPEDTVLRVTECGYCRGNETFRPAKVVVSTLNPTGIGDGS